MTGWPAGDDDSLEPQPGRRRVAARLTAVALLLILVAGVAAGVVFAVR